MMTQVDPLTISSRSMPAVKPSLTENCSFEPGVDSRPCKSSAVRLAAAVAQYVDHLATDRAAELGCKNT